MQLLKNIKLLNLQQESYVEIIIVFSLYNPFFYTAVYIKYDVKVD